MSLQQAAAWLPQRDNDPLNRGLSAGQAAYRNIGQSPLGQSVGQGLSQAAAQRQVLADNAAKHYRDWETQAHPLPRMNTCMAKANTQSTHCPATSPFPARHYTKDFHLLLAARRLHRWLLVLLAHPSKSHTSRLQT